MRRNEELIGCYSICAHWGQWIFFLCVHSYLYKKEQVSEIKPVQPVIIMEKLVF